jgi:hypothetical protein
VYTLNVILNCFVYHLVALALVINVITLFRSIIMFYRVYYVVNFPHTV